MSCCKYCIDSADKICRDKFCKCHTPSENSIREQFIKEFTNGYRTDYMNLLANWWLKKLDQRTEEIIKLSDEIETKSPTSPIEEWKAFKYFRNTLRDKYLSN